MNRDTGRYDWVLFVAAVLLSGVALIIQALNG